MNLTTAAVSFPIMKYRSTVTHVTSRRSMAMEWLLLAGLANIEHYPEYGGMSTEEYFSTLFGIKETDALIKPLIPDLISSGAVKVDKYSDSIKMTELLMSDFTLTDTGRTMHSQGKLPGMQMTSSVTAYLDPVRDKLWLNSCPWQTQEKAGGIEMGDVNPYEMDFPALRISNYLDELRGNEESRPKWMAENTEISEIIPETATELWYNEQYTVSLDNNMELHIEGMENENAEKVLDAIAPTFLSECENLPEVNFTDPEKEIEAFGMLKDEKTVENWLRDNDGFFAAENRINADCLTKDHTLFEREKGLCVKVICGANKFKCNISNSSGKKNKRMVISVTVPEKLSNDETVFITPKKIICAGRMALKYKSEQYKADVIYKPKLGEGAAAPLKDIIVPLVAAHYRESDELIFILYPIDRMTFESYLLKLVNSENDIAGKIKKIDKLNDISMKLITKKYLDNEKIAFLLVGAREEALTADQAISYIDEFSGSFRDSRKNDDLLKKLLKAVFEKVNRVASLDELYAILKKTDDLGKDFLAFSKNNKIAAHLYSQEIKEALVKRFADEEIFSEIPEYTKAEEILLELRRNCDQINEIFPGISILERESEESWLGMVLNHRKELGMIYRIYSSWQENITKFKEVFGDTDVFRECSRAFSNAVNGFEKLGDALGSFYCDMSSYGKICVADSSSLLNCNHLIERFKNLRNAMLIIPQTVLEELDGLKKSPEKGQTAQSVIREIEKFRGEPFLNISESSCVNLLPPDFDKNLKDNRIVSVALKYQLKKPTFLTDDVNLANKADSLGITVMTGDEYFESLKNKQNNKSKK